MLPEEMAQAQFYGLSEDEERQLGATLHPQLLERHGGAYGDSQLGGYVAVVGAQVAAASGAPLDRFTFTLVNDPEVNAFALPGGYVYICRGLIALLSNEAELAGVLGHELGHTIARHRSRQEGQKSFSRLLTLGLGTLGGLAGLGSGGFDAARQFGDDYLRSYSREHEFEADELGIAYMSKAGYEPSGTASVLFKLREYSRLQAVLAGGSADDADVFDAMATHPQAAVRVARAGQIAQTLGRQGRIDGDAYLDAVEGLAFGGDPDEGLILGRTFVHRGLGFRFDVPEGFRMTKRPGRVVAVPPGSDKVAIVFDRGDGRFQGPMTQYAQFLAPQGVILRELERLDINGMEAATGWYEIASEADQMDIRVVAVRLAPGDIFSFQFLAPLWDMARLGRVFRETTYSFRRLTALEMAGTQIRRVHTLVVGARDTVPSLALLMKVGSHHEAWFRLLNGLHPRQEVKAGDRVKLVV
ncbi:MAG: M48 family metalloprotease [Alphaproteobacteria bacterium]